MRFRRSYLPMTYNDPREALLNKAAVRLAELLRKSKNPAADRAEVVAMLRQADLWNGGDSLLEENNPISFAVAALEENPLLFEAVANLRHDFEPKASESPAELVQNLIPSLAD